MMTVRVLVGVVAVAAALAMNVVSAAPQIRRAERDPRWTAPASAASLSNPLSNRPDAAAGGAKLFHSRCATCHGGDGRGTSDAPALDDSNVQAQADGELFWKISSGNTRTGMPGFSFLPDPQRWQLVLHLRTLPRQK